MNPESSQTLPLRDIHLPEAVSWWPPALGWWLLLALLILLPIIVWAIHKFLARQQLRKLALAELNTIEAKFKQQQNSQQLLRDISALLRRICISRFPRHDVAGLTGEAWANFLNSQAHSFDAHISQALVNGPFQKQYDIDAQALINASRDWIKQVAGKQP
ncbi:MAG TPA: DUF4381 domain-containing protein [Candidatus Tenderia electrophaga]|uniref:DUF4381 domain-containing protein n=1 Tax=Candidatus Tenderia electrophaga TaxID=1748243 RepID=A0A832J6V7_9GAMM|nr:DUF4381 domain-containing protein [Candidatus Tenderia electrophaga]